MPSLAFRRIPLGVYFLRLTALPVPFENGHRTFFYSAFKLCNTPRTSAGPIQGSHSGHILRLNCGQPRGQVHHLLQYSYSNQRGVCVD